MTAARNIFPVVLLVGVAGFLATSQRTGWAALQEPARTKNDEPDDKALAAQGIRSFRGRHIVIRTDARDRSDVESFAEVFDQAVPQWAEFFGVDPLRLADWQLEAMIIVDRPRFERVGLFPADLPQFLAGYQRGQQIWVYLQPGDYYTRHLLLHEGTHAVMNEFLGGLAAPWYAEGMAELIGLNQWGDGKLTIGHRVTHRDEVPYWGRVTLLRKAVDHGELKTLDDVFAIPGSAFRQVESYAWSWAACEFLSHNSMSAKNFADLVHHCADDPDTFNRRFASSIAEYRDTLEFEWRQFLLEIDYGYDVERAELELAGGERDRPQDEIQVNADRGWQATHVGVEKGKPITLSTSGEFQIAFDTEPWLCRANGVTIEYYRGLPLGRLIAAIMPSPLGAGDESAYPHELAVIDVGERATIVPEFNGQLYLRINESPAHWRDNKGSIRVQVR